LYESLDRYTKVDEIVSQPGIAAIPFRPVFYDLAFDGIQLPEKIGDGSKSRKDGGGSGWW
jgi:hypothetical protein